MSTRDHLAISGPADITTAPMAQSMPPAGSGAIVKVVPATGITSNVLTDSGGSAITAHSPSSVFFCRTDRQSNSKNYSRRSRLVDHFGSSSHQPDGCGDWADGNLYVTSGGNSAISIQRNHRRVNRTICGAIGGLNGPAGHVSAQRRLLSVVTVQDKFCDTAAQPAPLSVSGMMYAILNRMVSKQGPNGNVFVTLLIGSQPQYIVPHKWTGYRPYVRRQRTHLGWWALSCRNQQTTQNTDFIPDAWGGDLDGDGIVISQDNCPNSKSHSS